VLKSLRGVPGVKSATLLSTDGAAEELPAGVHSFQVTGASAADIRPHIASAVVGAGHQLLELRTVRPTLEEVFINVISQEQAEDEYLEEVAEEGDFEDGGEEYEESAEEEVEEEVAAAPVRERVVTRRRGRR
jgi:hypothetical protein